MHLPLTHLCTVKSCFSSRNTDVLTGFNTGKLSKTKYLFHLIFQKWLQLNHVNTVIPKSRVLSVLLREKLKQLIEKRIGKENFVEKLVFVAKHELYSRAAQKPQPVFPSPEQMLFDHEFTKLVKELEGEWETLCYPSIRRIMTFIGF